MNYKCVIEYLGTNYHGWALQPNLPTIHKVINDAFIRLFNYTPMINASGRTDAGVHALHQVINIQHEQLHLSSDALLIAINSQLPNDVHCLSIEIVDDTFHAQYSALNKTYEYIINTGRYNTIHSNITHQYNKPIDITLLKDFVPNLLGTHDFVSFSTSTLSDTTRTIYYIKIEEKGDLVKIVINGSGFLKNMVRMIVGALLAYNEHKITSNDILKALKIPQKGSIKYKMSPEGLYLIDVKYKEH